MTPFAGNSAYQGKRILVVESDVPIVVQFTRQDTRQRENAGMLANAWAMDET